MPAAAAARETGIMLKLESLTLNGYRSFASGTNPRPPSGNGIHDDGGRIEFGDVTVLLGANGAGKSNVISFFRMLAFLSTGALQEYIGRCGYAESILHYGASRTPVLEARLEFTDSGVRDVYSMRLAGASPDTLIFLDESIEYAATGHGNPLRKSLGSGHKESRLEECANEGDNTCKFVLSLLRGCRPYHLHDTSDEAKIRKAGYIEDNRYLRSDAGNLAAFLYALRDTRPDYYRRIISTIQQAYPQFGDFRLEPSERNFSYILLNWFERHHPDYLMGPHQLPDGALRFIALATVFLQPPEKLPRVIVIDEPELGLHPHALSLLAGLIGSVTEHSQIILATQSVPLVSHFDLSWIRVVEHREGASHVLRFDREAFADWLEEYSTGELWEKSVIGGGPRHE